jgi:hypothetical protein
LKSSGATKLTLLFHLRFSGALLILLGAAHVFFDRRLSWKHDTRQLSPVNWQIFAVHWFYIALALVMLGALFASLATELLRPEPLTQAIFLATTIVWAARLFIQWFVFDRALWRGDRLNRAIHYLLTAVWIYLLAVNAAALVRVSAKTRAASASPAEAPPESRLRESPPGLRAAPAPPPVQS